MTYITVYNMSFNSRVIPQLPPIVSNYHSVALTCEFTHYLVIEPAWCMENLSPDQRDTVFKACILGPYIYLNHAHCYEIIKAL